MSVATCQERVWVHRLDDDLESHVHLLTWLVLRYLDVGLSAQMAYGQLVQLFEDQIMGGWKKGNFLVRPRIFGGKLLQVTGNAPLNDLLMRLWKLFAVRHGDETELYRTKEVDSQSVLAIFEDALRPGTDWPPTPPAHDVVQLSTAQDRQPVMDSPYAAPSRLKRNHDAVEDDPAVPARTKRTRIANLDGFSSSEAETDWSDTNSDTGTSTDSDANADTDINSDLDTDGA
jgi:hypothetical protein